MLTISAVILHGPEMDGPSDLGLFFTCGVFGTGTANSVTSDIFFLFLVGIDCNQYLQIGLQKPIVLSAIPAKRPCLASVRLQSGMVYLVTKSALTTLRRPLSGLKQRP
jgi:hypothetical protein